LNDASSNDVITAAWIANLGVHALIWVSPSSTNMAGHFLNPV
jgi:hypothetical protein